MESHGPWRHIHARLPGVAKPGHDVRHAVRQARGPPPGLVVDDGPAVDGRASAMQQEVQSCTPGAARRELPRAESLPPRCARHGARPRVRSLPRANKTASHGRRPVSCEVKAARASEQLVEKALRSARLLVRSGSGRPTADAMHAWGGRILVAPTDGGCTLPPHLANCGSCAEVAERGSQSGGGAATAR